MKLKHLSVVMVTSLLCQQAYSQQLGGTNADAKLSAKNQPDGTSLSSIYSPNLYDGSANLNFPIFQYTSPDGDNLGVSLGYTTKGIKADQE